MIKTQTEVQNGSQANQGLAECEGDAGQRRHSCRRKILTHGAGQSLVECLWAKFVGPADRSGSQGVAQFMDVSSDDAEWLASANSPEEFQRLTRSGPISSSRTSAQA